MAMITTPIPDVNGAKSVDQKIEMLLDSYFMLRKEIEYSLHNIGFENFDKDFEIRLYDDRNKLSNLISTNEVFLSRIEDAEGNITTIQQTTSSITTTVSSHTQTISGMQTNISQIEQTATQISSTVATHTTDISGIKTDYSSIVQTVNGISTTVSSHTGQITTINQNATSLTSRVSTAEGNISTVTQTANSLTTRVGSAEGNITTIQQTTTGITAAVNATKLEFNSSGLTIKNGGFKILQGSTQLLYVDGSGNLNIAGYFSGNGLTVNSSGTTLKGGSFKVTDSGSTTVFSVNSSGYIMSRGIYVGASGTDYSTASFQVATDGIVRVGRNGTGIPYYLYSTSNTYKHYFFGDFFAGGGSKRVEIGSSSDYIYILGTRVKWGSISGSQCLIPY